VSHVHLTVHRRGGGEVLSRLLALAGALIEIAERGRCAVRSN
jgi:hypothetical protein